jgi:hypothetical protein
METEAPMTLLLVTSNVQKAGRIQALLLVEDTLALHAWCAVSENMLLLTSLPDSDPNKIIIRCIRQ